jgi:nitroreductase/NAD-dependent dihydropyrimidine dehydrogenase PreA subunit
MNLFQADRQSCSQDGACAAVCPLRLISIQEEGYPAPIDGADEKCIRCGHCVAVCPTASLSHSDISAKQCAPVRKDLQLSADHCEHFLRARRSIRIYENKPVPRSDIARLIDIARYAPSGCNSQCAEWLVLDNRDEIGNLAGLVSEWMRWMLANMPEMALAMHLNDVLRNWDAGNDIVILRDAPVAIIAHAAEDNPLALSTCTIALSYLELAATSLGLGCCWAGFFSIAATSFPPMKQALSLPEGHKCFGAMMVGYPMYEYQRIPSRKDPSISWRD